jgi:zinc transport system substrate-binding protein
MRPFAALLLCLCCVACGATDPGDASGKLVVATSIPPHAWLIERIGGDAVEVHTVLRPGESPTTHQPSDLQVSRVLSGAVFFSAGVPFESGAWFDALGGLLDIVSLSDGVADRVMEHHSHDHGHAPGDQKDTGSGTDPHAWLSPSRLMTQARIVAETLGRLDPDHASDYTVNLETLIAELVELDRWIQTTLAPHRGRAFVVFHPSWGYYADDYGLEQIAIEIEGKQPTDAELTGIKRQTAALGISVIYVQPQIAGQAAEALADAIGARVETLDPLESDVSANLRLVTTAIVIGMETDGKNVNG